MNDGTCSVHCDLTSPAAPGYDMNCLGPSHPSARKGFFSKHLDHTVEHGLQEEHWGSRSVSLGGKELCSIVCGTGDIILSLFHDSLLHRF